MRKKELLHSQKKLTSMDSYKGLMIN